MVVLSKTPKARPGELAKTSKKSAIPVADK